jgi:peptidyl-prolyl cis-trans isomerase B (cyclophilin B)
VSDHSQTDNPQTDAVRTDQAQADPVPADAVQTDAPATAASPAPQTAAEREEARQEILLHAVAEQRRRAKRRVILLGGLGATLVLALVGGVSWVVLGGGGSGSAASGGGFCADVAPGSASGTHWDAEPPMTISPAASYQAVLRTSCGTVRIDLNAKAAPHTVNSFAFLARQHYFDHSRCHRLTTRGIHVLQCGDPTGTGTGSPGYGFPSENLADPRIQHGSYPAGIVAMANTGRPNSNGSQFFLVYQDSPLPPDYTPFGTVTAGLDVLRHIAQDGSDSSNSAGDGRPNDPVVLNSVTVTRS